MGKSSRPNMPPFLPSHPPLHDWKKCFIVLHIVLWRSLSLMHSLCAKNIIALSLSSLFVSVISLVVFLHLLLLPSPPIAHIHKRALHKNYGREIQKNVPMEGFVYFHFETERDADIKSTRSYYIVMLDAACCLWGGRKYKICFHNSVTLYANT